MDNNKRPDDMVRITTNELAEAFIEEQVKEIQAKVGDKKVLLALSGGVDSSVVAALAARLPLAEPPEAALAAEGEAIHAG